MDLANILQNKVEGIHMNIVIRLKWDGSKHKVSICRRGEDTKLLGGWNFEGKTRIFSLTFHIWRQLKSKQRFYYQMKKKGLRDVLVEKCIVCVCNILSFYFYFIYIWSCIWVYLWVCVWLVLSNRLWNIIYHFGMSDLYIWCGSLES